MKLKIMKLNIFAASFALFAGMTMVSCSEGQYWDEVSHEGDVYGFAKPAETVRIPSAEAVPEYYIIHVRRSNKNGELTIPVTHSDKTGMFSGEPTVTFHDGSLVADYKINIAPGAEAGLYYDDKITLAAPEVEGKIHIDKADLTLAFSLYHELNWVSGGKATLTATGFFQTAENQNVEVEVEVATNWPKKREKMCRLVSPFHQLDPKAVPAGYDIWFILDDYNEAYKMYEPYQFSGYIGQLQEEFEGGYAYFGTPSGKGRFISKADVFTMSGVLTAASVEDATKVDETLGQASQSLRFVWPEYDKAATEYGPQPTE